MYLVDFDGSANYQRSDVVGRFPYWVRFLNLRLGLFGLTLLFMMVYPVFEMLRLGLFFQIRLGSLG